MYAYVYVCDVYLCIVVYVCVSVLHHVYTKLNLLPKLVGKLFFVNVVAIAVVVNNILFF